MGDGELQEGQNWEAIMYAYKKRSSLIAVDLNGKQIDGSTRPGSSQGAWKKNSSLVGKS